MNMSFESASLDAIRWERRELKKADALYWAGKNTDLTDKEYDEMAEDTGHICQPPATLKGWAKYPDYCLACPNYGLKKVSYEIAQKAVIYWPKWDGIYLQSFEDKNGLHFVTRGDGRIGKDLIHLFKRLKKEFNSDFYPECDSDFELVYPVEMDGRKGLVKDLACNDLSFSCAFIDHLDDGVLGAPPRAIPDQIGGYPIDGWVIELENGEKFKYKG